MTATAMTSPSATTHPTTVRRRLTRTAAFPALLVGSLVSTAAGAWLVVDRVGTMTTTLTDGSATGVEVYAGQAWVTVGAVLMGAGLVGLALSLTLAVAASALVGREILAPKDDGPTDARIDDEQDAVAPAADDTDLAPHPDEDTTGPAADRAPHASRVTA